MAHAVVAYGGRSILFGLVETIRPRFVVLRNTMVVVDDERTPGPEWLACHGPEESTSLLNELVPRAVIYGPNVVLEASEYACESFMELWRKTCCDDAEDAP